LGHNPEGFARQGLGETFRLTYSAFAQRALRRRKAEAGNKSDKYCNPLAALQSAPGGGKSFFLDELAARRKEDLDQYCEDDGLKETLSNSAAVCITYNRASGFLRTLDDDHVTQGLALRMLWAYFIRDEFNFCNFVEQCQKALTRLPSPEEAFRTISRHCCGPVLLCVDELIRASDWGDAQYKGAQCVLSVIGQLLSAPEADGFNAIISTLDTAPVTIESASGREIRWVPLQPLQLDHSIALFTDLNLKAKEDKRCLILGLCISDCNGHPRSLEQLHHLLRDTKRPWLTQESYVSILKELSSRVTLESSFEIVQYALQGLAIPSGTMINTGSIAKPFSRLITEGTYLNAVEVQDAQVRAVPKLSPLRLFKYAQLVTAKPQQYLPDEQKVAEHIHAMLQCEEDNFHPLLFERFHACWEVIYRIFRPEASLPSTSVTSFYRASVNTDTSCFIVGKKKRLLELDCPFPIHTPITKSGEAVTNIDDLTESVILPAEGNPGFDVVIFERKINEGYVAINIECRYSKEDVTTRLNNKEIKKKYHLVLGTPIALQ